MVACSHFPWLHFFGRGHLRGLVKGSLLYGNEDDDSRVSTTVYIYLHSIAVSSGLSAWPSLLERLWGSGLTTTILHEHCEPLSEQQRLSFCVSKSQWPEEKFYHAPLHHILRKNTVAVWFHIFNRDLKCSKSRIWLKYVVKSRLNNKMLRELWK